LLVLERFCQSDNSASVIVVDGDTFKVVRELPGRLTFLSPDGRYVVTEQFDVIDDLHYRFGLELWDFEASDSGVRMGVATDARPLMSPEGTVLAAVPTPADERVDAPLVLWRLDADAAHPMTMGGSVGTRGVAFIGDHLVGVGTMGTAVEWDPSASASFDTLFADPSATNTKLRSAVSPGADVRAVSDDARTVSMQDLASQTVMPWVDLGLLDDEEIGYVFFSSDASFAPDGTPQGGSLLVNIVSNDPDFVGGDAQCPDTPAVGSMVIPLTNPTGATRFEETLVGTSADGGRILFRSFDGTQLVIRDAVALTTMGTIDTTALEPGSDLACNVYRLDATGDRVAGTNQAGEVIVWSVADGLELRKLALPLAEQLEPDLYGLAFSPDGTTLAVKSVDQTLWLVDLVNASSPIIDQPLASDAAARVVFSPDGSMIAVDGTYLFDASTLRQMPGRLKPAHWNESTDFGSQATRFVEEGEALYLVVERVFDSEAVKWRIDGAGLRERACALAGRNLSQREFTRYFGFDATYHETCTEARR
jgi:hypothetical protein